jgi:hypothetical protein
MVLVSAHYLMSFWHFDFGTAKWDSGTRRFGHNRLVRRAAATIERFARLFDVPTNFDRKIHPHDRNS